jgi:hypothetical protein
MSWLIENKTNWRPIFLVLLGFFIVFGPWGIDRVSVPLPYDCGTFSFRLDENFCAQTISGLMGFLIGGIDTFWILLLLLLPLLSTLLLLIKEAMGEVGKLLHLLQMLLLGLVFGGGLFLVYTLSSELSWLSWRIWGFWLYLISIGILLGFETLSYATARRYAYA